MTTQYWESLSDDDKLDWGQHEWKLLTKAQQQEWFRIGAERRRKREEQAQARIRQQSPEHQQMAREQLDKSIKERAAHRFQLTRQPNAEKCSTKGCNNRKLPYSDKCNSCESD
jgi:hypothetical protein